jgi:oxygen-dependent protoporphyrinogen oxidase
MKKHVIVIGGGLAGTAAAHTLLSLGYEVTIIERNDRLGGRIRSELVCGAAVEMGAAFLTKGYTNVRAFLTNSGLEEKLYRQHSKAGIFRSSKVRMLTIGTLAGNGALSWGAKLHALPLLYKVFASWPRLDPHAFWRAYKYDTRSVANIFTSRSGKEFLEYVMQPALNGYFYWTPEHTSEAMLLILSKAAFSHQTFKMRGGLQQIPEKAAEGSKVLLGHIVEEVSDADDGTYTVIISQDGKRRTLRADGIVCATTASVVPTIFHDLNRRQLAFFESIEYSSGALVARTYMQEQTVGDKGIAFPRQEGISLSSVTVSSELGDGKVALANLKTYASGTIGKELCEAADSLLTRTLVSAMGPVREAVQLGDPEPLAVNIQRWPEALPMFDVGHFKRLREFENGEIEDTTSTIVFAGDYIGGPFMEGAFTSGQRAAERLSKRL